MKCRSRWLLLAVCLAAACGTTPAQEISPTLELLGHLPLRGPRADIWAHKNILSDMQTGLWILRDLPR